MRYHNVFNRGHVYMYFFKPLSLFLLPVEAVIKERIKNINKSQMY